ncbi:hypothetical protein [Ruminococcus flavefaciens]|uniref:hypothetical protein n=1 Tax=Ruminococcus flavefaciens TaxID=1265 RepID=UPI00048DE583|nr:hypothetical protein [Ruminococcus flavefaciens]
MEETEDMTAEEDTVEALTAETARKKKGKADDIIAFQAVVCILLAAAFFAGNMLYPQVTGALFGRLRSLASDSRDIMPNPIDLGAALLDKL